MSQWKIIDDNLITKWAKKVDVNCPLAEYPRPQLRREEWLNLNGLWNYKVVKRNKDQKIKAEGKILVPFAIESALSGVKRKLLPNELLIYSRTFVLPDKWKNKKVVLNFEAVDWEAKVHVNGAFVGSHKGGYTPFSFNITDFITFDGDNKLEIIVWDPTDKEHQERGKQSLKPWLVFYSGISGIWQTVWIEAVPFNHIDTVAITPKVDSKEVVIETFVKDAKNIDNKVLISIYDQSNTVIAEKKANINSNAIIEIPEPFLWEPNDPYLYSVELSYGSNNNEQDVVKSYFGMRKISYRKYADKLRFELNNEPIFLYGTLDQGYWPDGLYSAPTDEALKYDIEITKELGFNLIRKHIKVEPRRWYYHADTLGMLVWQDFPNGGSEKAGILSYLTGGKVLFTYGRWKKEVRDNYYREITSIIRTLYNFPSIIAWIPFNEGWGQFETKRVTDYIRILDNTRLIDSASGWVDKKCGDIKDIHKYVGPAIPKLDHKRVPVLGEFGGLGLLVEDHYWKGLKPWAYKTYNTEEELFANYSKLIDRLIPLIEKGLGAAIYTQLTDVEREMNGLLTYDRIPKLEKEKIKEKNKLLFNFFTNQK